MAGTITLTENVNFESDFTGCTAYRTTTSGSNGALISMLCKTTTRHISTGLHTGTHHPQSPPLTSTSSQVDPTIASPVYGVRACMLSVLSIENLTLTPYRQHLHMVSSCAPSSMDRAPDYG